jgi:hypothetical protein
VTQRNPPPSMTLPTTLAGSPERTLPLNISLKELKPIMKKSSSSKSIK